MSTDPTCSRCGHPQSEHVRVAKDKRWNPAGMGFIHSYCWICPTAIGVFNSEEMKATKTNKRRD